MTSEGLSPVENLNICSDNDGKQKDPRPALETQDPTSAQCIKTNESDQLEKDEKSNLAMERDAPSRSLTGKHYNMELRTSRLNLKPCKVSFFQIFYCFLVSLTKVKWEVSMEGIIDRLTNNFHQVLVIACCSEIFDISFPLMPSGVKLINSINKYFCHYFQILHL